jgi:hypothetical protein
VSPGGPVDLMNSAKSAVESVGTRASRASEAGTRGDLGVVSGDVDPTGLMGDFRPGDLDSEIAPEPGTVIGDGLFTLSGGDWELTATMRDEGVPFTSVAVEDERDRSPAGNRGMTGLSTDRGD